MKATQSNQRMGKATGRKAHRATVLGITYAMALSAVMLFCVSCTRNDTANPNDTTTHTTTHDTAHQTTEHDGILTDLLPGTGYMDPDAGTVNPDGNAGNPPAGTEHGTTNGATNGTTRSRTPRSHFMH